MWFDIPSCCSGTHHDRKIGEAPLSFLSKGDLQSKSYRTIKSELINYDTSFDTPRGSSGSPQAPCPELVEGSGRPDCTYHKNVLRVHLKSIEQELLFFYELQSIVDSLIIKYDRT